MRRPCPQRLLAQSGVHPVQRACQYPSTQPKKKIKLPDLKKRVVLGESGGKKKERERQNQRISDAEWRSA